MPPCFLRVVTSVLAELQILVDCSGDDNEEKNPETAFSNKKSALVKIIEESPVRKTIIFCNKVSSLSLKSLWIDHDRHYKLQHI